ncbi:hypothetical protein [Acinetobacter modestus]|uniref:hypothetical protein n=1 Tax=Acinetobacter modestus TaxID=1776740 RepID=UPI001F4A2569|nr:hypothetical protein [Acinetobacter modestus]MCH7334694.1 hypothetical protein [Acinetobacter modestus]
MSSLTQKINLSDFQDHAELTQDQMKKLWALFSQIQHNLKQEKVHPDTVHLAEIGNYLTDMWAYDNEELYNNLTNQLEAAPNE